MYGGIWGVRNWGGLKHPTGIALAIVSAWQATDVDVDTWHRAEVPVRDAPLPLRLRSLENSSAIFFETLPEP